MYAESAQQGEQQNKRPLEKEHNSQHPLMHCANCDIEILWTPTVVQGKTYCCTGCAAGGPCNCDYSLYRSVTIAGVVHYRDGD